MIPPCPKCNGPSIADPDPSYYGEMWECTLCGFRAYFDAWNNEPECNDPF